MNANQFNNMLKSIEADCHETGMSHWLVPRIAKTIQKHIKVEEPKPTKCICSGFYKPQQCPVHGTA